MPLLVTLFCLIGTPAQALTIIHPDTGESVEVSEEVFPFLEGAEHDARLLRDISEMYLEEIEKEAQQIPSAQGQSRTRQMIWKISKTIAYKTDWMMKVSNLTVSNNPDIATSAVIYRLAKLVGLLGLYSSGNVHYATLWLAAPDPEIALAAHIYVRNWWRLRKLHEKHGVEFGQFNTALRVIFERDFIEDTNWHLVSKNVVVAINKNRRTILQRLSRFVTDKWDDMMGKPSGEWPLRISELESLVDDKEILFLADAKSGHNSFLYTDILIDYIFSDEEKRRELIDKTVEHHFVPSDELKRLLIETRTLKNLAEQLLESYYVEKSSFLKWTSHAYRQKFAPYNFARNSVMESLDILAELELEILASHASGKEINYELIDQTLRGLRAKVRDSGAKMQKQAHRLTEGELSLVDELNVSGEICHDLLSL